MGDSAAILWESELLRARQWLTARRTDRQQETEQLFQRVKMHIGFIDHQRSLQSETMASEDEDDMALDFLGDVDVSDMNALLQAEAAKATGAGPFVESVSPTQSPHTSVKDLMKPLEMPMELVLPHLKVQPVPMSQVDPMQAMTATAGATTTLGDEAGVQELMQELALDVLPLGPSEGGDETMKESTPPHVLKSFGGETTTGSKEAKQFHHRQEVSSKSPQAPHKKKADTSATMQQVDVAEEMLSWVSGYRDPEVIRRKENMRRKRKHTHRYGVASEEERRQVLLQVKQITRDSKINDSGSESDDNMSSDYSPAEEEEVSELDENEVVVLFSDDDCLDSDEERQCVEQKKKRLRRTDDPPKKKKSRSRKPTVTRKLAQQSLTNENTDNVQEVQPVVTSAEGKATLAPATTKSTFIEADSRSKSTQPVVLLPSENETEVHSKDSILEVVEHKSTSRHGADGISSNATEPERTMQLTIIQENRLQKESGTSKMEQNRGPVSEFANPAPLLTGNKAVGGYSRCQSIFTDSVVLEPNEIVGSPTATRIADTGDTELSDTGTIDLEIEELPHYNDEYLHEEAIACTTKVVLGSGTAAEQEDAALNMERIDKITNGGSDWRAEAGDEDISEAETEILEDDGPNTDYVGLDYCDDSYSGSNKVADQKKNSLIDAQKDVLGNKKGETEFETKATHDRHTSAECKQKELKNEKENKVSASTTGVQQFFDFAPLQLKSKVKTVTSTAPKPLPVHSYTVTHSKLENGNVEDTFSKKTRVGLVTPSIGSNGLRRSKKPIATITTTKGKYLVTRRCTKVLDDAPETKRLPKRQYTMVVTKKPKSNGVKDPDDMPLAILAKELSKKSEDTPQTRYLSYAGAKKTEEPPSYVAEAPRIVSKSRFGGGGGLNSSSSTVQNSSAVSNGQHQQMTEGAVLTSGYRREPQISIYDALHMNKQESASDIYKKAGYKRPSRFKKMQEEAARTGTPMVKSQVQDKDWDKVPIPKKQKQAYQFDEDSLLQPSNASDLGTRSGAERLQSNRCKKNVASSNKNSGSSYYGPQASKLTTLGKHDSPLRGRRGQERSKRKHDNDRTKKRSPSPPSRDRVRYNRKHRLRDDRGRRGPSRSRSRSSSPRRRDYSKNRKRSRSRSRSLSQEKSSERGRRRSDRIDLGGRDRYHRQETSGKRRSRSAESHNRSNKKRPDEPSKLDEGCQKNGKTGNIDRSVKKQKTSRLTVAPPSPGASATFDDEENNVFISDSDDDENDVIKEDIRFDLDSVPVDEALITRQVYVTGLNPTVCAEQIEEDFARFGVGVDLETGFPAIEVFACQRNYLGRGDARVTFKTEEGAQEAVEELNSKNVKNSMIHVRRMDIHTQRILTLQFQAVRDTWKCTRTQCRADVSVWNAKCDKCGWKRVYGPSNIKIGAESWLCSLCFTANESFATSCHGCMESLPEIDRSTFYTS